MEDAVSGLEAYLDWQERLKRFESSGLSIEVFCQQEDVCQSTFVDWLGVLKREQQRQAEEIRSAEGPAFVPVTVRASSIEILLPGGGPSEQIFDLETPDLPSRRRTPPTTESLPPPQ
jgi:hypothetical protein